MVPGCVFDVPRRGCKIFLHVFCPRALAVEEELDSVEVGVDPDGDLEPFVARPVPVRKDVGAGLGCPQGQIKRVEKVSLRKPQVVDGMPWCGLMVRATRRARARRDGRSRSKQSRLRAIRVRYRNSTSPSSRCAACGGVGIVGTHEARFWSQWCTVATCCRQQLTVSVK